MLMESMLTSHRSFVASGPNESPKPAITQWPTGSAVTAAPTLPDASRRRLHRIEPFVSSRMTNAPSESVGDRTVRAPVTQMSPVTASTSRPLRAYGSESASMLSHSLPPNMGSFFMSHGKLEKRAVLALPATTYVPSGD